MATSKQIIDRLKLQPNPAEGGLFASTYVSALQIADAVLLGFPRTPKGRALCSAIYYFIEVGDFSAMHRVTGDMIYHFYMAARLKCCSCILTEVPICVLSVTVSAKGLAR
jgi:predicted cupin superfamily sugar epimerase